MTWTYSGDPSKSRLDKVRFLIGDTDREQAFLSDEEIESILNEDKSDISVAAKACEALVVKLIVVHREMDRAEKLRESCQDLKNRAKGGPKVAVI